MASAPTSSHASESASELAAPPDCGNDGDDVDSVQDVVVQNISPHVADVQVGVKRQSCSAPVTDDDGAAPSDTERHVAAKPSSNAVTCTFLPALTFPLMQPQMQPHVRIVSVRTDGTELAPDAADGGRLVAADHGYYK